MNQENKKDNPSLYPYLTEKELKEAEEALDQYLELVLRIFNRINSDNTEDIN